MSIIWVCVFRHIIIIQFFLSQEFFHTSVNVYISTIPYKGTVVHV